MSDPILGTTSMALNVPRPLPEQRTYVTFGQQRGGTSAVAGVQRALGLFLGEIDQGNNEDQDFRHTHGLGHLREAIRQRDEAHDVWGYKMPTAGYYLPVIEASLRNPFYVAVFRDPVATALSRARWDGPRLARATSRLALTEANTVANMNIGFALATERPVLLISSAAATADSAALIDEIAMFLGVATPDGALRDRLLEYLEPGSYKDFHQFFDGNGGVAVTVESGRPS